MNEFGYLSTRGHWSGGREKRRNNRNAMDSNYGQQDPPPPYSSHYGEERLDNEQSHKHNIFGSISSKLHSELKKDTWCRNCGYWIRTKPGSTTEYWRTNLVVAADCPVCQIKVDIGLGIIHPWLLKFEDSQGIQHSELDRSEEETIAFWNKGGLKETDFNMRMKSLVYSNKAMRMSEKEFMSECLKVLYRWKNLEQHRRELIACTNPRIGLKAWCRNCGYWIDKEPFAVPSGKTWETGIVDSRDCLVCQIKVGLSAEISNDLLADFDCYTFRHDPCDYPRKCKYNLLQKFWRQTSELEKLGKKRRMNERDFENRCDKLVDIWDQLEADRRRLEFKSQGRVTT